MKYVYSFLLLVICALGTFAELGEKVSPQPSYGTAFDEVVVDTSLNVMKRKLTRGARGGPETDPVVEHIRQKRQRPRGFRRPGFGASAANAQAQGFQSQGPLGGFGASAANTQTQAFQAGPRGITGTAGLSGSQTYNLPGGHHLNVAYTQGFSVGRNGRPNVTGGQHRPGFGAFPASPSFGASAANAQAQGFQSQGPLGGFGASAANTQTQGFQAGPDGIRGSAGLSGSQTYNLPNGQNLNIAYTNGLSYGPDGKPAVSQGSSIGFTG